MSVVTETGAWTAKPAELLTARLDRLPMMRTIWTMAAVVSLGGLLWVPTPQSTDPPG